ncbi:MULTISPECIES: SIS domain-containing protein [Aliiglaciecola]|uniref:SIS domain-containing protein n=1 Tax=Aliiglaciecola TaxID=1406885 RepID=UPI001C08126D|nr:MULTISPECIES: SIS domain-containing protein [Aliiglaciecola]MBU2878924.1 SIS domain-containing protein [Aliiglaciecola lipolytica]MDO6712929.1 SIS domain-containing protein [Aliiglaciecola sp. 2_MG-2023]MDO6753968.1 SIS domain-containing protein [Aliiglaciecola sp. 1_MG-2023]
MNYLNFSEEKLAQLDGYWTAKEISQQPECWQATLKLLQSQQQQIEAFLTPILNKPNIRIIFTGAGTSAFVGQCVTPIAMHELNKRVEAIPTTDLVSNPSEYFQAKVPTLLVSFARSGNSPESVAALEYADQLVDECYQLAITCNSDGELAKRCEGNNKLALYLPEQTNDRSFAMTSSFSSMLLSALYLFCPTHNFETGLNEAVAATTKLLNNQILPLSKLADKKFSRVVYLGSGTFKGLAQESALKLLELTDGQTMACFDSPLGFRHGPKAMIDANTLVIVYISNNPLTRQYDLDLVNELHTDDEAGHVLTIRADSIPMIPQENEIVFDNMARLSDRFLLLPFIACAQVFGFFNALSVGNKPDNPSASGTVNRVVKGVNIHTL